VLVPAWNGPDLQCRRDGELSAGRTAFPKRGSRWSASRCRMGRAEIKFPPSVRHSRKTGCRTQKEVFYHAANPNAYEPVPNTLFPCLLARGQSGHEVPQAAGLRGADDCGDPGPVSDPRHPHLAHQAHLGLPGPVGLRPGVRAGAGAGLWLCGGYSGLCAPAHRGLFPRLHPVHHGGRCTPCSSSAGGSPW